MMKRSIALFLLGAPAALGFASTLAPRTPPRSSDASSALSMAKGGRGGLSVSGDGKSKLSKPKSLTGSGSEGGAAAAGGEWTPTSIPSISSLPKEKNVVKLVDTNVPALIDRNTNPTGAVSVVNYEDKTYCVSSSCGSCQIPLTKAKVLDGNDETGGEARLQCDFCGATYDLRTGSPVQKEGGKLLGFLFSKNEKASLPVYGLGERGGKVFLKLP